MIIQQHCLLLIVSNCYSQIAGEPKNSCVKIKRHKSLMKYRVCFFSFCKACNSVLCVWEERNQLWTNCNRINSETTTTLGVKGGDYFQDVFSLLRFIFLVLVFDYSTSCRFWTRGNCYSRNRRRNQKNSTRKYQTWSNFQEISCIMFWKARDGILSVFLKSEIWLWTNRKFIWSFVFS